MGTSKVERIDSSLLWAPYFHIMLFSILGKAVFSSWVNKFEGKDNGDLKT